MDAMRQQIGLLTEELNQLKSEIVNVKSSHASLHQASVDANTQYLT